MNASLLLAATTALLKSLLENGLVEHGVTASLGGDALVSAQPPSRLQNETEERARLNLFLYSAGAVGIYTTARNGAMLPPDSPLAPRAFELQYLISAHGAQDLHCEILLGYAMERLHTHACLSNTEVSDLLARLSTDEGGRMVAPALRSLAAPDLAERIESVMIAPMLANTDKMLDLWAKTQSPLRLFQAYKVTTALVPPMAPAAPREERADDIEVKKEEKKGALSSAKAGRR